MTTIKNVTIAGASGALGVPVLNALVKSGKFNITAIVRSAGKASFDPSVKVVETDFSSVESLTKALQGQDAVVSTVGTPGVPGQSLVIDAAVAAGVQRFIPSDFGSDLENPKTRAFPVFQPKSAIIDHIEEAARKNPGFSYTYIHNGAFLDWGLEKGFLFNWQSGKPTIYDGGDQLVSATSLASIGQAVVGVLSNPEETKNRGVFVSDISISQNRLHAIINKIAPELKLEVVHADTEELRKAADEKVAKGDFSLPVLFNYLFLSLFGNGYGGHHTKSDNKLLGIPGRTEADVEAILKSLIDAKANSA